MIEKYHHFFFFWEITFSSKSKLFRDKLIEVLGDITHLERIAINKSKEASADFQNYLNNFTKVKLELMENRIKKEFDLNEKLRAHLAYAVF